MSLEGSKKTLYTNYALAILTIGFICGELGHFLLGVTSKATAIELHYGDITCQFNSTTLLVIDVPIQCDTANSSEVCNSLTLNGTQYCEWNYNGLGLDYQLLAGPSFMAVFSFFGVVAGIAADRFNRVLLLTVSTAIFSVAVIMMGRVSNYWELFAYRMLAAAGEAGFNPLASSLLSDWFTQEQRGLAMAIYNWGVFAGQGVSYPIGRYITELNIQGLGWRMCYYGTGVLGIIATVLTGGTLTEPEKQKIGEESRVDKKKEETLWKIFFEPKMVLLLIAACFRQSGGYSCAYNLDLYYRKYFPDYNLSWWLFIVTTIIGSIGVVVGGAVSDKFVAKMGVKSRVFILGLSQLFAAPFSFGAVYFEPTMAMISLAISYFWAEMWLGILFAIIVEIVPSSVRSKTVGIFLFVINNVGGNLPIIVEPVTKKIGYRESLCIFYAGFYFLSSVFFFITTFAMHTSKVSEKVGEGKNATKISMIDVSKSTEKIPAVINHHST